MKLDKFGWHTERQSCTIIYTSASVSASLYQHIQAKTICVGSWACSFQIHKNMNFHVCRQLVYYAFSLSLSFPLNMLQLQLLLQLCKMYLENNTLKMLYTSSFKWEIWYVVCSEQKNWMTKTVETKKNTKEKKRDKKGQKQQQQQQHNSVYILCLWARGPSSLFMLLASKKERHTQTH